MKRPASIIVCLFGLLVGASGEDAVEQGRIDHLIRRQFGLGRSSVYTLVSFTNGTRVAATEIFATGGVYTITYAYDKKRSIFTSRLFDQDEVASIDREDSSQFLLSAIDARGRPPASALHPLYHERVIALVFDHYLATYPESEWVFQVKALRGLWVDELKKLKGGFRKIGGRWYFPGEEPPKVLPPYTKYLMGVIRDDTRNGRYLKAAAACMDVRIPEGFEKERAVFKKTARDLSSMLDRYVRERRKAFEREKQLLKENYGFQAGKTFNRSDSKAVIPLRKKAGTVRDRIIKKYHAEIRRIDADLRALEDEVKDYQEYLKTYR